jgi:hypothetical protein|tara:strand:+ start:4682 stop:4804 length:123 start_codon:yes stop_codon:yes gene_type:complete
MRRRRRIILFCSLITTFAYFPRRPGDPTDDQGALDDLRMR